jgi:hypothetical protein
MNTKSEFENFIVNSGNSVRWTSIPHIGAKFKIIPSLAQAVTGFLTTHSLDKFIDNVNNNKSREVVIYPQSENNILWDGKVRYKIV